MLTANEQTLLEQIRRFRAATESEASACPRSKCVCRQVASEDLVSRLLRCLAAGRMGVHTAVGEYAFWMSRNLMVEKRKSWRWRFDSADYNSHLDLLWLSAFLTHSPGKCMEAFGQGVPVVSKRRLMLHMEKRHPIDERLYGYMQDGVRTFIGAALSAEALRSTRTREASGTSEVEPEVGAVACANSKLAQKLAHVHKARIHRDRHASPGEPSEVGLRMLMGPSEARSLGDCKTIVEYLHSLMQRATPPNVCFATLLACPDRAARAKSCGIPLSALLALGQTPLSWVDVQAELGIGPHDDEDQTLQCLLRSTEVSLQLLQVLAAAPDSWGAGTHDRDQSGSLFAAACVASVRRTADGATADATDPSLAALCTARPVRHGPFLRDLLLRMCLEPPCRPALIDPGSAVVPTSAMPAQPSAPLPVRITRSRSLGVAMVS